MASLAGGLELNADRAGSREEAAAHDNQFFCHELKPKATLLKAASAACLLCIGARIRPVNAPPALRILLLVAPKTKIQRDLVIIFPSTKRHEGSKIDA
ncbi:MAG: hypothetical protein ACREQ4_07365 [Candidatus Binataceae bacterium]